MKHTIASILLVFILNSMAAQVLEQPIKLFVQFTDKAATPYSLDEPAAFLSEKAIQRRANMGISIDESDLPVTPAYVQGIKDLGAEVLYTSKWFNGAAVSISDSSLIAPLLALPYIENGEQVARIIGPATSFQYEENIPTQGKLEGDPSELDAFYNTGFHQLKMLNGDYLHSQGFTGEGMDIAILDGGFNNANSLSVFTELYQNDQVVNTYNMVEGNDNVYQYSGHGTIVFCIMGGNEPGTFVGAAPGANYHLFVTENVASETRLEEYNWLAAVEIADSIGVDLVNTSLGYSTFDDPSMNYTYNDMNGDVAVISRAADIAASKGMLLVSSAGNKGHVGWKYITAPGDADSTLTVGAVDSTCVYAFFSSQGPTVDGQVKPDVAALGFQTHYMNAAEVLTSGNGTSFSSPIICGLAACLWQANPSKSNMEIIQAIQESANQYNMPDTLLGYGVPNFYTAFLIAGESPIMQFDYDLGVAIYPNPVHQQANLYIQAQTATDISIELYDAIGRLINIFESTLVPEAPNSIPLGNWSAYSEGIYLLKIRYNGDTKVIKALKAN